jgi:uncharacterized protein YwgA
MLSRNFVLLALNAFGGRISGKTLLTKRIFFLSELLGQDLGYYPHYYGPYSDEVSSDITILKNLGLIAEESFDFGAFNENGFEVCRYDYRLTEEGQKAVIWLQGEYPVDARRIEQMAKRIQEAGSPDYVDLSIAAKAYLILKRSKKALTTEKIIHEAKQFSWRVNDRQIHNAVEFLKKLNLISIPEPVPAN